MKSQRTQLILKCDALSFLCFPTVFILKTKKIKSEKGQCLSQGAKRPINQCPIELNLLTFFPAPNVSSLDLKISCLLFTPIKESK